MTNCSAGKRKDDYFLNFRFFVCRKVFTFAVCLIKSKMIPLMSTQAMNKAIADYFKTQPIVKAWLFGSFARGEETPLSDVDLLVVYDDKVRVSLLKHSAMINDLEDLLDRPVDLVEDGTLLPFAVESANRDKKLIYERAY